MHTGSHERDTTPDGAVGTSSVGVRNTRTFRPPLWRCWIGFVIGSSLVFLGLVALHKRGLNLLALSIAVLFFLLPISAAGGRFVQYVLTVVISPTGVRLRLPLYRPTSFGFDQALSVRFRRPLGVPQLYVATAERRLPVGVPMWMGLPGFLEAVDHCGGSKSKLAVACAEVLAKREAPPN